MAGASKTKIVLLGTGNPGPDPDRSGPATAIVVNGTAYLIDFGPGVVRRAAAAFLNKDITTGKLSDLIMLVLTGGKERTMDEYRKLLASAGFRFNRLVPTATELAIIEAAPA